MELSEGLAALEGLQALERRLDARLKDAKAKAARMTEDASARAIGMIREKEARIASLKKFQKPEVAAGGAASGPDFAPNAKLVEETARDILEFIKKSG